MECETTSRRTSGRKGRAGAETLIGREEPCSITVYLCARTGNIKGELCERERERRRGGEGRRGMEPDREPPRRGRESHPATRRVRELKVPKAQKGRQRRANEGGVAWGVKRSCLPLCQLHITEPRWSRCHLVPPETD